MAKKLKNSQTARMYHDICQMIVRKKKIKMNHSLVGCWKLFEILQLVVGRKMWNMVISFMKKIWYLSVNCRKKNHQNLRKKKKKKKIQNLSIGCKKKCFNIILNRFRFKINLAEPLYIYYYLFLHKILVLPLTYFYKWNLVAVFYQ